MLNFKNKTEKNTRYISKIDTDLYCVEIAFNGGAEDGKGNPKDTNVITRCLKKANPILAKSPWQLLWQIDYGSPIMPDGAWHGIKLVEMKSNELFLAISNKVYKVSPETGEEHWVIETGNTPIYQIIESQNNESLIVFNGYYKFETQNNLGNIAALNHDGSILWRAELPAPNDIYANAPYYDSGELKSSTWKCYNCTIDEITGKIINKVFTK